MNELELKHLAPYLPYELMFLTPKHRFKYGTQESLLMTGLSVNLGELIVEFLRDNDLEFSNTMKWVKPILHPISDLKKEIEVKGEKFIPAKKLEDIAFQELFTAFDEEDIGTPECSSWVERTFISWHFDIFGLIQKDLAIDINTLKS